MVAVAVIVAVWDDDEEDEPARKDNGQQVARCTRTMAMYHAAH